LPLKKPWQKSCLCIDLSFFGIWCMGRGMKKYIYMEVNMVQLGRMSRERASCIRSSGRSLRHFYLVHACGFNRIALPFAALAFFWVQLLLAARVGYSIN
jgi:hypothetical protein